MTQGRPMTDEEFAELLLKPHVDIHDMEQAGGQEVREMRAALHSYRHETLHWAQRRSAGQPSLATEARAQARWAALPQWALAMVALVTIAGGVAHVVTGPPGDAETQAKAVPLTKQTTTSAEIAADNSLLSSIDAELDYHGASPVDDLRLQDGQLRASAAVIGATD